MDQTRLARLLYDRLNPSIVEDNRHIIQFRNSIDYKHCLYHLQQRQANVQKQLYTLPSILAIACSLESTDKLLSYNDTIHIEKDTKVHISHKPTTIPIVNRSSIMPFIAKNKIPWGVKRVLAPQTWKWTTGKHVRIGVIDTGADYSHPDLRRSLGRGVNMLNRTSPPYDDNGHGTHIAGTIAANNSDGGISGIAPGALVYPVKAFDHQGSAYVSDIIMGIHWCVSSRMNIVNMSFGMKKYSDALREAIRYATRAGVIVVASSGNDGKQTSVDYPAMFSQTISVGAFNKKNLIASFSNKGKHVDVYAPGEKIYSTWLGNKYGELSGTSMATSHVSAVIALMLSLKPDLTPRQVKHLLRTSQQSNKGTLNARYLIKQLRNMKSPL